MSHVAIVDVEITNLEDLAVACKRLGLELAYGQQEYHWFGKHVGDYPLPEGFSAEDLGKCEHAIRLSDAKRDELAEVWASQGRGLQKAYAPKPYEIGVCRRRDGKPGWSLLWDFWLGGNGLQQVAGDDLKHLRQAYSLAAATRTMKAQGFTVTEQVQANGSVRVVCSK